MGWALSTRTRIVVSTLVVLGLLDLGRSLYARVGYARPTEVWQPLSSLYADLSWPPGLDLPATASVDEHIRTRFARFDWVGRVRAANAT